MRDVLIAPSGSSASGVVTYVAALARMLGEAEAAVLGVPGSPLQRNVSKGAFLAAGDGSRSGLARAIRAHSAEFGRIETHGPRALLAARSAGVPVGRIYHMFHEFPQARGPFGWAEMLLSLRVSRAANSPALARSLRRIGIPVDGVVPPIVDPVELKPRGLARAAVSVDEEGLAVGVVGRLSRLKDPALALDAVGRLSEADGRRATIAFVGEGPLAPALRERAAEIGVEARFPGPIPNAASLLSAFDVVVVPSRRETFCLSLAEAIQAEVPVAAVASPGSRWLTNDGRLLGLSPSEPRSLAKAIAVALESSDDERSARRVFVRRKFNAENANRAYRAWVTGRG